jgi:hypothetical protein
LLSAHLEDDDFDIVPDYYALMDFPSQHQHRYAFRGRRRWYKGVSDPKRELYAAIVSASLPSA